MANEKTSVGKTLGVVAVAAAIVGGITVWVLPEPPFQGKPLDLGWDKNNPDYPEYWYEFASTTNIAKSNSWYFKARVQNTNRIRFYMTNAQEFFAVRTAIILSTKKQTNGTIITNWFYSSYSLITTNK